MMLHMFVDMGKERRGQFPVNRANLIQQFMDWTLGRRNKRHPRPIQYETTAARRSGVQNSQSRKKVKFPEDEFLQCVKQDGTNSGSMSTAFNSSGRLWTTMS